MNYVSVILHHPKPVVTIRKSQMKHVAFRQLLKQFPTTEVSAV